MLICFGKADLEDRVAMEGELPNRGFLLLFCRDELSTWVRRTGSGSARRLLANFGVDARD